MHIPGRGHEAVSSAEIDHEQNLSDQVTRAKGFIDGTLTDLYGNTHPYHASELTLLKLGLAANAQSLDWLAEAVRKRCVVTGRHGAEKGITPDAAAFGLTLSQRSRMLMDEYVLKLDPTQDEYDGILADNREAMQPERQIEGWPVTSRKLAPLDWQDPGAPEVTTGFLWALVDTADTLYAESNSRLNWMANDYETGMALPPEYASLAAVVQGTFFGVAAPVVDEVRRELELRNPSEPDVPLDIRGVVYEKAQGAFLAMSAAYIASMSPALLGEEFMPVR